MKLIPSRFVDNHLAEVVRGASLAFGLRVFGAGVSFALNVMIARALGPDGMGGYFLALTVMSVVAVIGRLGLDNVLLRHCAAAAAGERWGEVRWLEKIGLLSALFATLGLTVVVLFSADFLASVVFHDKSLADVIRVMCLAAIPVAGLNLYAQVFKGLKWSGAATVVQAVAVPTLALGALALLVWQYGSSLNGVAAIYLGASLITFLGAWWWLRIRAPRFAASPSDHTIGSLLQTGFPLLLVASISLIMTWTDTVLLGAWDSADAVGRYNAAARTAGLTAFVLMAVNTIAAPKYAALYAQGQSLILARLARRTTALMIVATLPVLLLFIVFPGQILSVFGEGFETSGAVLTVLALGQAVSVAAGTVGYLLVMTGHEKILRNNVAFCALVNLILNSLLIPKYGALGAATATALSLALMNLVSTWAVRKKLGFYAFPFFTGSNQG